MQPHEFQNDPGPAHQSAAAPPPEAKCDHTAEEGAAKRHFDSFSDAVNAAKEDACDKAREAAPKLKAAVAEAVHDLAYGGAFGAVFLGAFAAELVPSGLKEVLAKGAKAGREKAGQARDKVREAMTPSKNASSDDEVVIDLDRADPAGA